MSTYRPPFARMSHIKRAAAEAKAVPAVVEVSGTLTVPEPEVVAPPPAPAVVEMSGTLAPAPALSSKMLKAELIAIAAGKGIVADESMTKAEIVALIEGSKA